MFFCILVWVSILFISFSFGFVVKGRLVVFRCWDLIDDIFLKEKKMEGLIVGY